LFNLIFSCFAWALGKIGSETSQLLVIKADGWNTHQGILQRYQRDAENKDWYAVDGRIPIVLGRNGMAWGVGSQQLALAASNKMKQEGDGNTPAGIYPMGDLFGFEENFLGKMHYTQLTDTSICVDDDMSPYYNQLIDTAKYLGLSACPVVNSKFDPAKNPGCPRSGEQMRQVGQYKIGSIILYNQEPAINRGSCIFMHIWKGPDNGTAGCIAMAEDPLSEVLRWLDPAKKPFIVILPEEEYRRLQNNSSIGLPSTELDHRLKAFDKIDNR
jgi:D-alanyl-D-alanine dipeptidase